MRDNYLKNILLTNKKALVLGGSGLLGTEIINALSDAGCSILNLDLKDNNRKKNDIKFIKFDVGLNKFDLKLKKIIKKFNPDIFINCSYPTYKSWKKSNFKNINLKGMTENLKIHLNSYAWSAKLVADNMKKKKINGSIIQLSSIYGLVGQNSKMYEFVNGMNPNMTYSIIKGGITNLTRQMAAQYGKYNIRINNVCPGAVIGHNKGPKKKINKRFIQNYSSQVPMARLALPSEVAGAVLFLSSKLSSYITGTNLIIDGGWTAI